MRSAPPPALRCAPLALALLAFAGGCEKGSGATPAPSGARTAADATAAGTPPGAAPSGSGAAGAPAPSGSAAAPAGGMPRDLNVLMISVDSMRADMPWAGYERPIAPNLTKFEKESVSYTRHRSISSYTSMSLGGFLGARYPSELERSGYFFGNYPDTVEMFPEVLQKAGVRTLSAHAHFYFDVKAGFRQGFDDYRIVPDLKADNTTDRNVTSPAHLELAKQMLGDKANTGKRFFAWYHFLDPHDVYMPHKDSPSFGKKQRDLYDGEMAFTDAHVQKLLDFVAEQEWGKRTAIIITADHGEAFGEHGMTRHGFEVWDVLVHVPLMIKAPGSKPQRIDALRSTIDLPPTILEMLGVERPAWMQGKSLVPELYGAAPEARDVLVDLPRTSDNDRRRGFYHDKWKLYVYGDDFGYELYDLAADPGEKKDLKRDQKEAFEMMKDLYAKKAATVKDVCPKMTEKLKGKGKGKKC
jgi:choline-sulfatase